MAVPWLGLLTPVIDSGSPLGSVSLASNAEAGIGNAAFVIATNPLSLLATGGCSAAEIRRRRHPPSSCCPTVLVGKRSELPYAKTPLPPLVPLASAVSDPLVWAVLKKFASYGVEPIGVVGHHVGRPCRDRPPGWRG